MKESISMGLFDFVKYEYDLPLEDFPLDKFDFQTKSIPEPAFRHFIITKDKQLLRRVNKNFENKEVDYVKFLFTGDMNFYTFLNKKWYEYTASFDNGDLLKIEKVFPKQESSQTHENAPRRLSNIE